MPTRCWTISTIICGLLTRLHNFVSCFVCFFPVVLIVLARLLDDVARLEKPALCIWCAGWATTPARRWSRARSFRRPMCSSECCASLFVLFVCLFDVVHALRAHRRDYDRANPKTDLVSRVVSRRFVAGLESRLGKPTVPQLANQFVTQGDATRRRAASLKSHRKRAGLCQLQSALTTKQVRALHNTIVVNRFFPDHFAA